LFFNKFEIQKGKQCLEQNLDVTRHCLLGKLKDFITLTYLTTDRGKLTEMCLGLDELDFLFRVRGNLESLTSHTTEVSETELICLSIGCPRISV
jgi:hypothetical protein